MPAKIIFVIAAAIAAIACAVAAGLLAAVICLTVKMPTATLVTVTTESAAAAFGGVIALSGIAAGLFSKASAPAVAPDTDKPAIPAGLDSNDGTQSRPGRARQAASDRELRAAVKAYAEIHEAPPAQRHERRGSVMRRHAANGR